MYTCCPHCSAVFRVSAPLLGTAAGQARCGECRHSYTVLDHLYEDLADVQAVLGEQARVELPAAAPVVVVDAASAAEEGQDADASGDDLPLRHQPVLSGWHQQGLGAREVLGVFLMLLLLGTLGLQWVWFNRDRLVADPAWRAGLEPLCEMLHCDLPLQVNLDKLALIARDVRRHPSVESALLVNATFENQAGFTQPYPYLEISFSDRAGVPVAIRRFSPAEYLGAGTVIEQGLPAQGIARATLEIIDPGESAASFQFEFL